MQIRIAKIGDLQSLLDIYNYEVRNGVATFDLQEKTLAEWETWFYAHNIQNHPLIVAERDGTVVGYASLSAYREKEAFASTVELSVYVAPDARRKGVASALMQSMLDMARADTAIHTVVSVITKDNAASVHLHQKFSFQYCGTMTEVGMKFGQLLDIVHYQLLV